MVMLVPLTPVIGGYLRVPPWHFRLKILLILVTEQGNSVTVGPAATVLRRVATVGRLGLDVTSALKVSVPFVIFQDNGFRQGRHDELAPCRMALVHPIFQ